MNEALCKILNYNFTCMESAKQLLLRTKSKSICFGYVIYTYCNRALEDKAIAFFSLECIGTLKTSKTLECDF